jgi:creatinine amidohydrolase
MPSSLASFPDRGAALLRGRLESIPALLESWAASPEAARAARPQKWPQRVVATGLGSSEAHARYLVWLLNRFTDIPAEFLPTGALLSPDSGGRWQDRTLVVFSQGLSAHARIALGCRGAFARTVLFTAASREGLIRGGKLDRARCLEALEQEGAEVIRFPLEDEYTLLIRVVGPALGFLAARLWVGGLSRGALSGDPQTVGAEAAQAFLAGWSAGRVAWPHMEPAVFGRGFALLASPDLSEYLQNLAFKFVEGLFRPAPTLQELLQFAHGPFQQLTAAPRPVVVLHRAGEIETDQLRRIRELCLSASLTCHHTGSGLVSRTDLLVFEAEGLFAEPLLQGVEQEGVDQVSWPGRGLDGPLYEYSGPTGSAASR